MILMKTKFFNKIVIVRYFDKTQIFTELKHTISAVELSDIQFLHSEIKPSFSAL